MCFFRRVIGYRHMIKGDGTEIIDEYLKIN